MSPAPSRPSPAASRSEAPQTLPLKVELLSLEAADQALEELGRLNAREAAIQAECDREIARVREHHSARMHIQVDRVETTIADRRQLLLNAVEKFAAENRESILEGESKSRELNHGTIGWRAAPRKIEPVEGGAASGNPKIIDALMIYLRGLLSGFKLLASKVVGAIKVQVSFDKRALLKLALDKDVSAAELRKAGFFLAGGEDALYVNVKTQEVSSLPAAHPE